MFIKKFIIVLFFYFLFVSCSKEVQKSSINQVNLESQMIEAYREGIKELERGDVLFAAKKFNEAEVLFPQSDLAPKSALMAAYAYYSQNYYGDAISELERFLKVYPKHKNIDYAQYLLALSFYEQIVDEKKDLRSIINAKSKFELIIQNYPQTAFAEDASYKIDLINDILAAKEMYVGRYYFEKKKWISAIKRFRNVVDEYDTTIYIEEALYRLVELHYIIGLNEEAKKYAKLLGYNHQSSEWYEKSYIIFNERYVKNSEKLNNNQKRSKKIINKFKSLFD